MPSRRGGQEAEAEGEEEEVLAAAAPPPPPRKPFKLPSMLSLGMNRSASFCAAARRVLASAMTSGSQVMRARMKAMVP